MELNEKIQTELNKIDEKTVEKYEFIIDKSCVYINTPDFSINIGYDKTFEVSCNKATFTIKNNKFNITLWKNVYFPFFSIYYRFKYGLINGI